MARAKKGEKFFLYRKARSGYWKGKHLLGTVAPKTTLQDLLDFLKQNNIEPSQVVIPTNFSTYAE